MTPIPAPRRRPLSAPAAALTAAMLAAGTEPPGLARRRCRCGRRPRPRRVRTAASRPGAAASPTCRKDKSATEKIVKWANWTAYLDMNDKDEEVPDARGVPAADGIKATYAEDIDDNDTYYGKIRASSRTARTSARTSSSSPTGWPPADPARLRPEARPGPDPEREEPAPAAQDVDFDPGREHSITWQSGFAGIGYSKDKVGRELKTLDDLWAPDLKGKIVVLSEMRDTVGLIMLVAGRRHLQATSPRTSSRRRSTCCRSRSTTARSAR